MEFRDVFDPMFRGQPPRALADEERHEAAVRLLIAKYRAIYAGRGEEAVERLIIESIGQEDYAHYGGIRLATGGAHRGP